MSGIAVNHKSFGKGIIIKQEKGFITVLFDEVGEKKLAIPIAFDFMSTDDEELNILISKLRDEEAKKIAEKAIAAQAESQPAQQITAKTTKREKKKTHRDERPNVAFKCIYCNGGSSEDCVGFKGICTDELINYNVKIKKQVWCTSDTPCRKYLNGEIDRDEIAKGFSCYESTMLTEWKAQAGIKQHGTDKGKPMKMVNVQNNSLAVLTTRTPESEENERFIFAVFLVDESYEGDGKDEGYVTNHSKWRIELKPEEAKKMLFWNYYINANAPEKIVFGSGLHRYLSDMQAAQILKDIAAVKQNEAEKRFAKEFLNHFCSAVCLNEENILPPTGALKSDRKEKEKKENIR